MAPRDEAAEHHTLQLDGAALHPHPDPQAYARRPVEPEAPDRRSACRINWKARDVAPTRSREMLHRELREELAASLDIGAQGDAGVSTFSLIGIVRHRDPKPGGHLCACCLACKWHRREREGDDRRACGSTGAAHVRRAD